MKKIPVALLGLTALLTACPGNNTPTPQPVTSLSGTVVEDITPDNELNLKTTAWTGGAGTVTLTANGSTSILSTGTLNADGSFSMALPATVNANLLTGIAADITVSPACSGKITASDPTAMGVAGDVSVDAMKDGSIMPMLKSGQVNTGAQTMSATAKTGGLIYVDRNVTVTGTVTCVEQSTTARQEYRLNLQKGWNALSVAMTLDYSATTTKLDINMVLSTAAFPTDKWVYDSAAPLPLTLPGTGLSVQKLPTVKSLNLPFLR